MSKGSQNVPKWGQYGAQQSQNGPKSSQMIPNAPKRSPINPKM